MEIGSELLQDARAEGGGEAVARKGDAKPRIAGRRADVGPRRVRARQRQRDRDRRDRGSRSSIAAAELHSATIRPIGPAGQIGRACRGAAGRVAHAPESLDPPGLGVLAERRGRPERDGVAQRLFGAPRIARGRRGEGARARTRRVRRAGRAGTRDAGDRRPAPRRRASVGAGTLRVVEELLAPSLRRGGGRGHRSRGAGATAWAHAAGSPPTRAAPGTRGPWRRRDGRGKDARRSRRAPTSCSPAARRRVSPPPLPIAAVTSTTPRSTRTLTWSPGSRRTVKCVPTTRTS